MKAKLVLSNDKNIRTLQKVAIVAFAFVCLGIIGYPIRHLFLKKFEKKAPESKQLAFVNSVRRGLIQKQMIIMQKCTPEATFWPSYSALMKNDITAPSGGKAICTSAQLPQLEDRRIYDPKYSTPPLNPFSKRSDILATTCGDICKCTDEAGYLYNAQTGMFGHKDILPECNGGVAKVAEVAKKDAGKKEKKAPTPPKPKAPKPVVDPAAKAAAKAAANSQRLIASTQSSAVIKEGTAHSVRLAPLPPVTESVTLEGITSFESCVCRGEGILSCAINVDGACLKEGQVINITVDAENTFGVKTFALCDSEKRYALPISVKGNGTAIVSVETNGYKVSYPYMLYNQCKAD